MRMPAYEIALPDINRLTKPVHNAIMDYRGAMDKRDEFKLREQKVSDEQKQRRLKEAGNLLSYIKGVQDPTQKQALYKQFQASDPDFAKTYANMPMDQAIDWVVAKSGVGTPSDPTSSMREYKLAQSQGYKGSFMDFKNSGAAPQKWGMTGQTVQGPDGTFYTVQYSNYGNRRITPLSLEEAQAQAQGEPSLGDGWASMREGGQPPQQQRQTMKLSPSRGVSEVDTGTGTLLVDKATGQPISQVSKDIAGAEGQKIEGKAMAEGKLALPKQRRALEMYEAKQQHMGQFFDKALALASETGTTGFVGGLSQAIPGSPAYRLKQHLAPIKAALGFEELQNMRDNSPTGGALGQVSEMELTLLNSALGSLDVAQSSQDVVAVINSIRAIRGRIAEMKRQAYQEDVVRFGGENVPNPGFSQPSPQKREFRIIGVE